MLGWLLLFVLSRAEVPCWGLTSLGEGGPGRRYLAGKLQGMRS
jgi:hypothetical protein